MGTVLITTKSESEPPGFSPGAVILAAGRSRRMGRSKPLLPWKGTTIIGHLLSLWSNLGAKQIAVVHAADDTALLAELERVPFPDSNRIANPEPERGMFSSIQAAARWSGWSPHLTHCALVLGDQPHLSLETLRAILDSAKSQSDAIVQPSRAGHGRHPVIFPKALFAKLGRTRETNLNAFLKSQVVQKIELDDPDLDLDLDTPEDYQRAIMPRNSG